jgi:Zn-finger nucleic acid-binding protein
MDSTEGITLDFCRGCGGVWLDAGEMGELMQFLEAEPPVDLEHQGGEQITCPGCAHPLTELEHPPGQGVLIDICSACQGIWLDRGELGKLRALGRSAEGRLAFVEADKASHHTAASRSDDSPGRSYIVVPILKIEHTESGQGIHWKWVILSTLIMMAGLGAVSLITEAMVIADSVTQSGSDQTQWVVGIMCCATFFMGGIICGWKSPGFTVWEPTISVIPAGILFWMIFMGLFSLQALGIMLGTGILAALVGGLLGERYGHH